MHVEVVQECEKRSLAVSINPFRHFLIDDVSALADSEGAAVTAGTLGVLIEQGSETEPAQRARDQAVLGTFEIDARKLPAIEGTYERVAGRRKIIFEVDKAAAKTQVAREVSPVGRECPGAIASLLEGLCQSGEAAHALPAPSQPGLRLYASNPVLELIEAGQQRNM